MSKSYASQAAETAVVNRAMRADQVSQHQQLFVVVLAVITAAAALTFSGVFTRAPNADQAFALRVGQGTWSELLMVAGQRELSSLGTYLLLRVSTLALGPSTVSLGVLVLLLYIVAVVATFLLGRRVMNGWIGALAGALLAVHGAALGAGERGIGQVLAMTLTVVAVLLLARVVAGNGSWMPFLVVAAIAPYVHVYCLPALLAAISAVLATDSRVMFDRTARWAGVCLGLAWLPIVAFLLSGRAANSGWVAASAVQPNIVPRSVEALAGTSATTVVGLTVLAMGLLLIARMRTTVLGVGPSLNWHGTPLVLGWSVAPLAIGLTVGIAVPVLVPESLVVSAPAVALATAAAVRLIWAPRLRLAVAALAVSVGMWPAVGADSDPGPDWPEVAQVLETRSRPDDVVVVEPTYERFALGYTLAQRDRADPVAAPAGGGSWDTLPLEADLRAPAGLPGPSGMWLVVDGRADPAQVVGVMPAFDGLREVARYPTRDHLVVQFDR